MNQTLVLIKQHHDRFAFRRDFTSPKRWICFWFGHVDRPREATLSYYWKDKAASNHRQVRTLITLPACKRCRRLLDYSISVGAVNGNFKIEQPQVTVGTI